MANYRRLVRNVAATFSGRIASVVLALLLSTFLFRWLGAQLYGIWSFFYVLVSYSSMMDLGLSTTIERFVARAHFEGDSRSVEEGLNLCFSVSVLISLVAEAVVLAIPASVWSRFSQGAELARVLAVFPLCLFLTNVVTVAAAGVAGIQRMGRLNVIRTAANAIRSILVLGAAAAGVRRVDVLLLVYSAAGCGAAWFCWRALEAELGPLSVRPLFFRWSLARQYLRFGSAVQASTLATQAGDQLLRLLIGSRFGSAWMGFYDLGTRGAYVVRSFASVLLTVMVPFGTEKHLGEGVQGTGRLHRLAVKYLALFVLPATAVVFVAAPDIVALWLKGAAGSDVVLLVFRTFLVGNAVGVLGGPAAMIGRSVGRPQIEAAWSVAGAVGGLALAAVASDFYASVLLYAAAAFGAALVIWARLASTIGLTWRARDLAASVLLAVLAGASTAAVLAAVGATGLGSSRLLRVALAGLASTLIAAVVIWKSPILDADEKRFWTRNASLSPRPAADADAGPIA